MNPYNLNVAVAVVANAIACQLTEDELVVWAAIFTLLGDMLGGISAIRALKTDNGPESPNTDAPDNAHSI